MLADTAEAQTTPVATLDKVVITGSHIAKADLETALPVQIITREEIERLGITTTAQLLERVPANVNGFSDALTVGQDGRPGLASANLRGLGDGSTLVLLNGRRLANYAFDGGTVDLNTIPLSAIDRVEILKDGASAIYGSDAIAGVINFILRKDYQGVTATGYGSTTQQGGGGNVQANLTFGFGDPASKGYNVFASIDYQKTDSLAARERSFARTGFRPQDGIEALSQATFPANIIDGRRLLNPTYASGCTPPSSLPLPPAACGFDFTPFIDLLPDVERASLLTRGTLRLKADNDVYLEYLVARNRFETKAAPTPAGPTLSGPMLYPDGGLYYPSAFAAANGLSGDLTLRYRTVALGPRVTIVDSDMQRAALGVEGLLAGWNYNLAAIYSNNSQQHNYAQGFVYSSKLVPAMATGLINPFGPSDPEGQALLASTQYSGTPHSSSGTTGSLGVVASRTVVDLPAGPLALALGLDARRERLSNDWDPAVSGGDPAGGSNLKSVSGRRNVFAAFAELNVPIVRGLDAQLALRYDDYSDFGSTTNPKVALRWQPVPSFMARGSWGTGFRAPPLYDLYFPSFTAGIAEGVVDPIRCPATGNIDDCDGIVLLSFGGNPELKPETSTQWGFGFVWQPARGLAFGADYWNIEQKQVISGPLWENLVASGSDRVIRGPVDPMYPNLPGPIIEIDTSLQNIGTTRTSGIDVSISYVSPKTEAGVFRVGLEGTYVLTWEAQIDGVNFTSYVGTNQFGGAIPRWRSTLSLNWAFGAWGATIAQNYTAGYTDEFVGLSGESRKVGAFATWDLQGTYNGFANWQLAAGIRNLLNSDPPFSNQRGSFQIGYDPRYANPLGRIFYLRGSYSFK